MIREGTILIPKYKTRIEMRLPEKVKVAEFHSMYSGKIESLSGEQLWVGSIDFANDFYNPSHVNLEVMNLLETGTDLVSFSAVTVDGKVIQIDATASQ